MAPNLAVLALKAASPQRWFKSKSKHGRSGSSNTNEGAVRSETTEHWTNPVPGTYKLGRDAKWFLIARDDDPSQPETPDQVVWCKALDRKLLLSQYQARSKKGILPPPSANSRRSSQAGGSRRPSREPSIKDGALGAGAARVVSQDPAVQPEVSFVMLDDGVTWLNDRNEKGEQTSGPWLRYCIDKVTGDFRPMRVSDDPRRSLHSTDRSRSASTLSRVNDASTVVESRMSPGPAITSRSPSVRKVAGQVHEAVPEESSMG